MLSGKKIDASPALTRGLSGAVSLSRQAGKVADNAIPKISEKTKPIKESGVWSKLWAKVKVFQAILGFVLIIQGSQFKNLVLCTQLVRLFLVDKVRDGVTAVWNAIKSAWEQSMKDDGDQPSNEGDEKTEQKSKQAQKREAAAAAAKKSGGVDHKENAKVAEQLLKALKSDEVSEAVKQVALSLCALAVVIHGGLPQILLVAHLLVGLILPEIPKLTHFSEHQEIQHATDLLMSAIINCFCFTGTFWFPNTALIIYTSAFGVKLIAESQTLPEKIGGQDPDVVMALAGAGFGALWQLWSYAQGGGLAWYFTLLYLPAVTAEGLLSLTARLIGGC